MDLDRTINDVHTADALHRCCRAWAESDLIAVDTEFVRERTYFPLPGLIQVATRDGCWLVDPTVGLDMSPLFELLGSARPAKVMHSASQDLELFRIMGAPAVAGLFDTQVAAGLAGLGDQPGFASLARDLLDIELPKGETRSDWRRRPLSAAQRRYAAQDVIPLPEMHRILSSRLRKLERLSWLEEDCAREVDQAWTVDPAPGLRRQRNAWKLPPEDQQLLASLWRWREARAAELDRPRRRVAEDAAINELVRRKPATPRELADAGMPPGWIRRFGDAVLAEIAAKREERPPALFEAPPQSPEERGNLESIRKKLRQLAEETGIPASMLATRQTLEHLAVHPEDLAGPPGEFSGWRERVVVPALAEALGAAGQGEG